MRAALLLTLVMLFGTENVPGQIAGYFRFTNRDIANRIDAPIFDAQGIPLEGTNYLAELYGGAEPDKLSPTVSSALTRVIVPFRILGYVSPDEGYVLDVLYGDFAWLQVRAWDARLGGTYEEVVARGLGGYGESPLFYAQSGGGGAGVPSPPNPLIGLQSFSLRPATGVLMSGIQRQGNEMVIQWLPGFKLYQLQQSAGVDQPWQNLGEPTTATSATNTVTNPMEFFRVIAFVE